MKDRIPTNLRRMVIERDGLRCVYCDLDLTNNEVHLHRLIIYKLLVENVILKKVF
jgi:5-methylcytosine-specific restriction endonuclease McrA